MSLRAATTAEEARFQYCNYGYDKSKYTSREDCLARYNPSPAVYTKPIDAKPIDDLIFNTDACKNPNSYECVVSKGGGGINPNGLYTKLIESKRIDDLPIGGGAAGGMNIPKLPEIKNKQVEPAKKNNLPMIIGVVVIGAILYFFYKKK